MKKRLEWKWNWIDTGVELRGTLGRYLEGRRILELPRNTLELYLDSVTKVAHTDLKKESIMLTIL